MEIACRIFNHLLLHGIFYYVCRRHQHYGPATSKQIIQTKSRKIWHDRWARGNIGWTYYQHQQTPNQIDPINQLHRAPLHAHLHRSNKEHLAKCVYCPDSDETVEHFPFHYPLYDNIRTRLLPAQPNKHNTLYGFTTQLQRTATYNMSAMNRRDKIVRRMGDKEKQTPYRQNLHDLVVSNKVHCRTNNHILHNETSQN